MSSCSVDYVRNHIHISEDSSITDLDIENIIADTQDDILSIYGLTDDSNPKIALAIKYSVLAAVLVKMKSTSELASSVETPGSKVQNTTDKDIEMYEAKANKLLAPFDKLNVDNYTSYSSPSAHTGFNCHGGPW